VIGNLRSIVIDAPDMARLAEFYIGLAGWTRGPSGDDDWTTLTTPDGWRIGIQEAAEYQPPRWPDPAHPQQAHLDLRVPDLEAGAALAVGLGAGLLRKNETWYTLADPAGHPFDLCQTDGVGSVMGLFAVTIDAPDALALARFYADLLGMEVTYEGPEGALIAGDGKSVMFQQVSDYHPPRWPDPAHPQQAHLDVIVDDLGAAVARAVELGATRLSEGGDRYRILADPAGHPFCLTL
jgi:catechol 2,3-dioxygenase-like lactoylglutathione lyase family enzyme